MKRFSLLTICSVLITSVTLSACAGSGVLTMGDQGAKTAMTGGAAGSASNNTNSALEKCSAPLGTVSLVENQQSNWYHVLTNQYKLPPTAQLLRLIIQQSNCFVVVERGDAGMNAMSRERELMKSGAVRKGSNFGKGQLVASDYGLSPEIIINESDTGGMGAAVGGLVGGRGGGVLALLAAGIQTSEASTMLTLVDNRSGVQVAASEGSASNMDFAGIGSLLGSTAAGGLGGYTRTPKGKVIAAAFMDSYNNMVRSLREYKAQEVKGGLGKGGRLKVGN